MSYYGLLAAVSQLLSLLITFAEFLEQYVDLLIPSQDIRHYTGELLPCSPK